MNRNVTFILFSHCLFPKTKDCALSHGKLKDHCSHRRFFYGFYKLCFLLTSVSLLTLTLFGSHVGNLNSRLRDRREREGWWEGGRWKGVSPLSSFASPLALPLTAHLPLIVNSGNSTGEDGKRCLTSVAIMFFWESVPPNFTLVLTEFLVNDQKT